MTIGLFTGSFDPMTNGHLDVIARGAKLFDKLYVGVFQNDSKQPLFSTAERKILFERLMTDFDNVEVIVHASDLTVNVAQQLGVTALLRSVRNAADLTYESEMLYYNAQMTGVETVLLMARPELQHVNSTRIKELAHYGADISRWVPDMVRVELEKKFEKK
ncbi:pantetheine-phosphate adenylyltransferase [Pseudolactococcus insecticola]|uniref:Phosphopantetheine adenylyltransferase n=1 Tax=Pseudolactococcus insecticola TaxID=2709158 RepID=A0A6A0B951_9LACT|nr:pantetheine-phosphate adenylyltransferase [Lactococcus insecticola]GFH40981.1 phosphopantetheine adenylyltransferase [Lactococcus insecticola]